MRGFSGSSSGKLLARAGIGNRTLTKRWGTKPLDAATEYRRGRGVTLIDEGCPLMFGPTADIGYKVSGSCSPRPAGSSGDRGFLLWC